MRLNYLAPAGTPISLRDFASWGIGRLTGYDALAELERAVRSRFGVDRCFFISSGRAAMYLLFETLAQRHPGRDEVVVPAYTCYSVAASAVKAGLKVRVCDIDPSTLSYDLDALAAIDYSRVLAIVTANLYGVPNDSPAIETIARRNGVLMVDDAAQAMNAKVGERYCGTFGDVGLFSLDKGKNITSMQGGILVTRSPEIAEILETRLSQLPAAPSARAASYAAQLSAYALLLRPSLYWIPERLLELGNTEYTTEYPVERYSPALAGVALRQFQRLDALSDCRRRNAYGLLRELTDCPAIRSISEPSGAVAVYARLPVRVQPDQREAVLGRLHAAGVGASASYPQTLQDVPELQDHLRSDDSSAKGGRAVARSILTLPTHPYVTAAKVARIGELIRATTVTGNAAWSA